MASTTLPTYSFADYKSGEYQTIGEYKLITTFNSMVGAKIGYDLIDKRI